LALPRRGEADDEARAGQGGGRRLALAAPAANRLGRGVWGVSPHLDRALDGDGPARALDDLAADGEAEAGPDVRALGGEERLPDARHVLRRDADAGVHDL